MKKYIQTKEVSWLKTPKETVWVQLDPEDSYIQPEDESLRESPLGVDLFLLYEEDEDLFKLI